MFLTRTGRRRALAAVAALFLGGLLAAAMEWSGFVGTVTVVRLPDDPAPCVVGGASVAVLSGRNRPGCSTPADAAVAAWERRSDSLGFRSQRVAPEALVALAKGVVVVPAGSCLAPEDAAELIRFTDAGGGLLLEGGGELPDRDGNDFGSLVAVLLGVEHLERLPLAGDRYVAVPRSSPLGLGVGATRLHVARAGFLVAAPGRNPYWSDARQMPIDALLPAAYQAAAVLKERDAGRVAWIGFDRLVDAAERDRVRHDQLLRNALAWVARAPAASVDPWPGGRQTAVLLQVNASAELRNLQSIAASMEASSVRGTFVLPTSALGQLPVPLASLRGAGEIAVSLGEAGPDAGPAARLIADRLHVRWSSGAWPAAVALGSQALEPFSRTLLAAGAGHVLSFGEADSLLPSELLLTRRFLGRERRVELVRLARTTADDFGLSPLGFGGLQDDWVRRRLAADYSTVAALGGLYVLGIHTQGLGSPESLPMLSALVREWKQSAWVTDAATIAAWWRGRAGLQLQLAQVGAGRYRLTLRSRGHDALRDVSVTLRNLAVASVSDPGPGRTPACRLGAVGADAGSVQVTFPVVRSEGATSCLVAVAP